MHLFLLLDWRGNWPVKYQNILFWIPYTSILIGMVSFFVCNISLLLKMSDFSKVLHSECFGRVVWEFRENFSGGCFPMVLRL